MLYNTFRYILFLISFVTIHVSGLRIPRINSYQKRIQRENTMLSSENFKWVAPIAISLSILSSPVISNAATTKLEKIEPESSTTYMIKKDENLLNKVSSLEKTKAKPKVQSSDNLPSPKFRTAEELALYNYNQKYSSNKNKIVEITKSSQSDISKEKKLISLISKEEKDLLSIEKRLSSKISDATKSSLVTQQNKLKSSLSESKKELKTLQGQIAMSTSELKSLKASIPELEKSIKSKEAELKKKLEQLALKDKKDIETNLKKEKALKIQNLKKSEAKAKSNVDKLNSYTDSTMKAVKAGEAELASAEAKLSNAIKTKENAEKKLEALNREIESTKDFLIVSSKDITLAQESVVKSKTIVSKLKLSEKSSQEELNKAKEAFLTISKTVAQESKK